MEACLFLRICYNKQKQEGEMGKRYILAVLLLAGMCSGAAAALPEIALLPPDKTRGTAVMQALSERKSTRVFAPEKLTRRDLSDLLWAANGVNRPDGKRTAPSALNRQDIDVYAAFEEGVYRYDAPSHSLVPVAEGDVRPVKAPVVLLLVAKEDTDYAPIDAGIVSQNIYLFCSGVGLATVTRGSMDADKLAKALKLTGKQKVILNQPVGYFQKTSKEKQAEKKGEK